MARLEIPVLLRWSDLDAYQHVNNASMLTLLEEARITAFWRAPAGDATPWPTAVLDAGPTAQMSTLVARQEIEYLRPLSYRRTPVIVEMWLGHLGGASLDVCYEMRDPLIDGEQPVVYARAATTVVLVSTATGAPVRIGPAERAAWEPYVEEPVAIRRRR
ncbi:acyl-CoA thioesterase [Cellulomonas sp. McL0617]|uniref:acyl-CoA thioesterase n=1 Tax=Cellulomonas sp. McL0617 TaxID=3415675 RepID=UPI003CF7E4FE